LRDRPEDIVPLAREMLPSLGMRGTESARLRPEAERALLEHDFPGNVRELKNVLERALLFSPSGDITAGSLMLGQRPMRPTPDSGTKGSLADAEKQHVITVLRAHAGDVPLAAQALGVPRSSLYAKLKRWGVRPRDV
jgi:DNA-binding NtrC family response regulator